MSARETYSATEIARRRLIEHFEFTATKGGKGRGQITCAGRTFRLECDDLLDLVQAIEMVMLRLTGKVLRPKFRAEVTNRAALQWTSIQGGDFSLYTGLDKAPIPNYCICDVTGHVVRSHYLAVEIEGSRWDNWFARLDELVKCLYVIVKEAQADPFEAKRAVFLNKHDQPAAAVVH